MSNHILTNFLARRKLSPDSSYQANLTLVLDRHICSNHFQSMFLKEVVGIIWLPLSGDVFMNPPICVYVCVRARARICVSH